MTDYKQTNTTQTDVNTATEMTINEDGLVLYSKNDRIRKKIFNFIWINFLSVAGMLGLFFLVLYGDFLTNTFEAVWVWFWNHQVIMALTAAMPFFAAMLVGRASSAKAKRKRLMEEKNAAYQAIEESRKIRQKQQQL